MPATAHREEGHRRMVSAIIQDVLQTIAPDTVVDRHLRREGDELVTKSGRYDLGEINDVFVLAFGKAAIPMAAAMERVLGDHLTDGLAVAPATTEVSKTSEKSPESIAVYRAPHPIPDERSAEGARRLLRLAGEAGPDDLVLFAISGGGSALTTLPVEGLTVDDLARTTTALLESGATIEEFNAVRKHLSDFAGGQLAEAAHPATHLSLILSDVVGNPVDAVASGPTVADPTTFDDALEIIRRYDLGSTLPSSVTDHLEAGVSGDRDETPGEDSSSFDGGRVQIIADNGLAAEAAEKKARKLGWNAAIATTFLEGEAREVATVITAIAREIAAYGRPVEPPACVIFSGETTVDVRGSGRGGRNQELALAALTQLRGESNITIATLATDGIDGPTNAAGAIADAHTWKRTQRLQLDARSFLDDNDAYSFFDQTDDLIITGATQSNVNDLVVVLVGDSLTTSSGNIDGERQRGIADR